MRAPRFWTRVVDRFEALQLSENTILMVFSVAIGAAAALGVIGFYKAIDLAYTAFIELPGSFVPRFAFLAYRPVLTGIGFVVSWWIVRKIGRGVDGLNVPDVQLAVARRGGHVPRVPALGRTLASIVTLGSGGSAGSEGPVAVLGASLGSGLGEAFRFDPSRVKILLGAGAAAAISAAFNAPLAGAFFALEEILGSFAIGSFPPVIISSVVGAVLSRAFFGNHPAFPIPREYSYATLTEVALLFPLLGIALGAVSAGFIRTYFAVDTLASRSKLPGWLVALAGGASVGILVFASGGLLVGFGHLAVRLELFGRLAWYSLALIAIGKIIATSITLNTGGYGGLFTPSLYIGAVSGGAFGVAAADVFPQLHVSPEAYALVGMGSMVAAATHAPITGILIVFEMTNDYAILLPLMLSVAVSYIVSRRIEPYSLYSGWLAKRGEHLEHGEDRDVLRRLQVRDAMDAKPLSVIETAPLQVFIDHLEQGHDTEFPVVNTAGVYVGVITLADVARAARNYTELAPLVIAGDLASPGESVAPNDSLQVAIRKLGVRGGTSLPVVDPDTRQLVGLVSRRNILARYERAVAKEAAT